MKAKFALNEMSNHPVGMLPVHDFLEIDTVNNSIQLEIVINPGYTGEAISATRALAAETQQPIVRHYYIKKTVARAIGSALMGAAAEASY